MKKKSYGPKTGKFKPRFPEKYSGNPCGIIYRSSLEWKCMRVFDNDPNVIKWQSEEMFIIYKSPINGRYHRYFPDFLLTIKNNKGMIENILVEVKPASQTAAPKKRKITQGYINEVAEWGVNSAKFEAAKQFCDKKGWTFKILTETEIVGKKK